MVTPTVRFNLKATQIIEVERASVVRGNNGSLWYSREELQNFKHEYCTGCDYARSSYWRREVVKVILWLQREQRSLDLKDPKGLRKFYKDCSRRCRVQAYKSALDHAQRMSDDKKAEYVKPSRHLKALEKDIRDYRSTENSLRKSSMSTLST